MDMSLFSGTFIENDNDITNINFQELFTNEGANMHNKICSQAVDVSKNTSKY